MEMQAWIERRIEGIKNQGRKLAYEIPYTAGTYADCLLSLPIWTAEKIGAGVSFLFDQKTPSFFDVAHMREHSAVFGAREGLRERLDTRPGALYIQSNCLALVPAFLIGMPAAEVANSGIEQFFENAPVLAQCMTNSFITLAAQMATGYTTYMANEVRVNREKYIDEEGNLKGRKIGRGFWDSVKAFWKFDLSYAALKAGIQTYYLFTDRDPWEASATADAVAFPLWYLVATTIGLRGGLIKTKDSERVYEKTGTEEVL